MGENNRGMFQCPLCLDVFNGNVVECPECYEIFCEECVLKAYKSHHTCPLCRKSTPDVSTWHRNLAIERRVGNLSCECENKAAGCTVVVTRFTKSEHESLCEFGEVKCKLGCGLVLRRKDFSEHQEKDCMFRPVDCSQGCAKIIKFCDSEKHITNECINTVAHCPNDCGAEMRRAEIPKHRQECELEVLTCAFSNEGCEARVLRKDYSEHIITPIHLSFAAVALEARDKRISRLEQEREEMKSALVSANLKLHRLEQTVTLLCGKTGVPMIPPPPPVPVPAPILPLELSAGHQDGEPEHQIPVEPRVNLPEVKVGDCVRIEDAGHLYPTVGRIPNHSGLESWPSDEIKKLSINTNWKRRHMIGDVGVVIHCTRHALGKADVLIVKVENDYVCVNKMGVRLLPPEESRNARSAD